MREKWRGPRHTCLAALWSVTPCPGWCSVSGISPHSLTENVHRVNLHLQENDIFSNILFFLNYIQVQFTSVTLDFFWSRSEFISCTNLSNVWTSIPGTCFETGSDSKYGFPRLRSTSTRRRRIWFRAVSIRYFSRFVLSNLLLASCNAW